MSDNGSGKQSPFYDAKQVAGQGVLGQALVRQAAQMDSPAAGLLAAPGGALTDAPVPTLPPPKIRQGFTLLDPKDWTPEETKLFNAQHDIKPPIGLLGDLKRALGIGQPTPAR